MTVEKIDALEATMEALHNEGGFVVEIEGEQFIALVRAVRDYTDRLAKKNGLRSKAPVLKIFDKRPNDLGGLRDCLTTQKEDPLSGRLTVEKELFFCHPRSTTRSAASAGAIVHRIREDKGMSRVELSAKTGIATRTIYALEQDESRNFGLENYLKILDTLDLAVYIELAEPPATDNEPTTGNVPSLPGFKLGDIWKLDGGGRQ